MGATGRKYAIVLASGVILPACSRDNRGDYDAGYDAGYEAGQEDAWARIDQLGGAIDDAQSAIERVRSSVSDAR
jgi:hypothetical protein